MKRSLSLVPLAVVALSIPFTACGGKRTLVVDGGAASASVSASSSPAETASPATPDPEREKATVRACKQKAERECEALEHDQPEFFDDKRAKIAESPFEVKVDRVWLKGACAKGDAPEKRDDTEGITALVEGKVTYKGDDTLFYTDVGGWFYLDMGNGHVASVLAAEKSYGYYGGPKEVTKLVRKARGSDPWRKGQARDFHWESRAISEAFCESKPKSAAVLMELRTLGMKAPVKSWPVASVPVQWDEVMGMAVREHVGIHRGDDKVDEAVDASFVRLDKMLVTATSGKAEWMNRSTLVQTGFFTRGASPTIPASVESPLWTVKVTGITGAKDFGGYSPTGDDQYLVIVDVELQSKAADGAKSTKAKSFGFQLETSPNNWQAAIGKATGQLDGASDIGPGEKLTGKLVFPRQRFERPFRLKIATPDRVTLIADVFAYEFGADAAK